MRLVVQYCSPPSLSNSFQNLIKPMQKLCNIKQIGSTNEGFHSKIIPILPTGIRVYPLWRSFKTIKSPYRPASLALSLQPSLHTIPPLSTCFLGLAPGQSSLVCLEWTPLENITWTSHHLTSTDWSRPQGCFEDVCVCLCEVGFHDVLLVLTHSSQVLLVLVVSTFMSSYFGF